MSSPSSRLSDGKPVIVKKQEPSTNVLGHMIREVAADRAEQKKQSEQVREKAKILDSKARTYEVESRVLRQRIGDVCDRLELLEREGIKNDRKKIGRPEDKKWNEGLSPAVRCIHPIDGKWKITGELGTKHSISVYEAVDIFSGHVVAVELKERNSTNSTTESETELCRRLQETYDDMGLSRKAPATYYQGSIGSRFCLVKERFGPSLSKLMNTNHGGLPVRTVVHIGFQVLYQIEALHSIEIVHSAISPDNIVCGLNHPGTWNLIDIDSCSSMKEVPGLGDSLAESESHRTNYAPVAAHRGKACGKSSDIESLSYVLLDLITGTLPWKEISVPQTPMGQSKILKAKENLLSNQYMTKVPRELRKFCREACIPSTETPSYAGLRKFLGDLSTRWYGQ